MNVTETMRAATSGNRAEYKEFVQTRDLGEAACWSMVLRWIKSARHGTKLLEQLSSPGSPLADAIRKDIIADHANLLRNGGDETKPQRESAQRTRLGVFRQIGYKCLYRHMEFPELYRVDELWQQEMARHFLGAPSPRAFVVCLIWMAKNKAAHAMAGSTWSESAGFAARSTVGGFRYFDPNGGELYFPFAEDFSTWFSNYFGKATTFGYDDVYKAEFMYYKPAA